MTRRLGIVGAEAAKFTTLTEAKAKDKIRQWIETYKPTLIVSGHCHLGGVDIWAEEIAAEYEVPTLIFPPFQFNWSQGYKPRNLKIAENSDFLICVVVKEYPPNYKGMRFSHCYHCLKNSQGDWPTHVKSGGCWTMWKAPHATLEIIE